MATKAYLFQPEKKALRQGFLLTGGKEGAVYEAKMLKQPLFGPMQFEFVNHLTGQTTAYQVGRTVTVESQNGGFSDMLSKKSRFRLDGKNIWDALHVWTWPSWSPLPLPERNRPFTRKARRRVQAPLMRLRPAG